MRFAPFTFFAALWLLVAMAPGANILRAEEFRIDTQIFRGDDKQPTSRNTTCFHGGRVYDFDGNGTETTVLDPAAEQFVMLDLARRVKTEITWEQIRKLNETQRAWAEKQPDSLVSFAAQGRLDSSSDAATGKYAFTSPSLTYRVDTQPAKSDEAASQYRQFADWFARLNATGRGGLPPFARLAVNKALAENKALATRVEVTMWPQRGRRAAPIRLHSEHSMHWTLTDTNLAAIRAADEQAARFASVDLETYRRPPAANRPASLTQSR